MNPGTVDVNKLWNESKNKKHLTITIKTKGMQKLRLRLWLCINLIRLGCLIGGIPLNEKGDK